LRGGRSPTWQSTLPQAANTKQPAPQAHINQPMLKKRIALLTPPERKRAGVLMGMNLVTAFLDRLGVASTLPFMAVLANPELSVT
jgi:hypothetical protein